MIRTLAALAAGLALALLARRRPSRADEPPSGGRPLSEEQAEQEIREMEVDRG